MSNLLVHMRYLLNFCCGIYFIKTFLCAGLGRQHLAPLRNRSALNSIIQKSHPSLQEVLNDLGRCKDHFIDTGGFVWSSVIIVVPCGH